MNIARCRDSGEASDENDLSRGQSDGYVRDEGGLEVGIGLSHIYNYNARISFYYHSQLPRGSSATLIATTPHYHLHIEKCHDNSLPLGIITPHRKSSE